MTRPFELIVFDWDGTLMDSEARIVNCLQAAVQDLGLESRTTAECRNIIGLGLAEALNTLYPGATSDMHRELTARYRYHYLVADRTPSELFPSAADTVARLEDQGYLLAVATGKGRQGLDKVLDETGMRGRFHATRCADETFSKPNPQMLLELMDELGVYPDQTLMIGDTEYDMLLALNAGVSPLAVSYGVHEQERLQQHGPLGTLNAIEELPGWLDNFEPVRSTA